MQGIVSQFCTKEDSSVNPQGRVDVFVPVDNNMFVPYCHMFFVSCSGSCVSLLRGFVGSYLCTTEWESTN